MQRARRGRSSPSLARQRQRPATLVQAGDELVVLRNRQGPRVSRCAIMGHEKDLLSALQRSFERIFLLFCSFGNPLSDFVGVNELTPPPTFELQYSTLGLDCEDLERMYTPKV